MGRSRSDLRLGRLGFIRLHWRGWTATGLAVAIVVGASIYFIGQAAERARLMRMDPDAIAQDAELEHFAVSYARPTYNRYCGACHGQHLQGDPHKGVPNLTDRDWLYGEGRIAQIERTILYGIRSGNPKSWNLAAMPAFGQSAPYDRYQVTPLEPGEIRDVIEYVLVTAGRPGDRTAAQRGAKIFAQKGQCFDCHSRDLQGDTAIGAPNLVDDIWLYGKRSRDDLYDTIVRGRKGICPAWQQQLSPVMVRALAVLVYVASHRQDTSNPMQSP